MIKLFANPRCSDAKRVLRILQNNAVLYEYINIDRDLESREFVKSQNANGYESIPVLVFADGDILVEPDTPHLLRCLRAKGLLATS